MFRIEIEGKGILEFEQEPSQAQIEEAAAEAFRPSQDELAARAADPMNLKPTLEEFRAFKNRKGEAWGKIMEDAVFMVGGDIKKAAKAIPAVLAEGPEEMVGAANEAFTRGTFDLGIIAHKIYNKVGNAIAGIGLDDQSKEQLEYDAFLAVREYEHMREKARRGEESLTNNLGLPFTDRVVDFGPKTKAGSDLAEGGSYGADLSMFVPALGATKMGAKATGLGARLAGAPLRATGAAIELTGRGLRSAAVKVLGQGGELAAEMASKKAGWLGLVEKSGSAIRGAGDLLNMAGEEAAKAKPSRLTVWERVAASPTALPSTKRLAAFLNNFDGPIDLLNSAVQGTIEGSAIGAGLGLISDGEEGMVGGFAAGGAMGAGGGLAGRLAFRYSGAMKATAIKNDAKAFAESHEVGAWAAEHFKDDYRTQVMISDVVRAADASGIKVELVDGAQFQGSFDYDGTSGVLKIDRDVAGKDTAPHEILHALNQFRGDLFEKANLGKALFGLREFGIAPEVPAEAVRKFADEYIRALAAQQPEAAAVKASDWKLALDHLDRAPGDDVNTVDLADSQRKLSDEFWASVGGEILADNYNNELLAGKLNTIWSGRADVILKSERFSRFLAAKDEADKFKHIPAKVRQQLREYARNLRVKIEDSDYTPRETRDHRKATQQELKELYESNPAVREGLAKENDGTVRFLTEQEVKAKLEDSANQAFKALRGLSDDLRRGRFQVEQDGTESYILDAPLTEHEISAFKGILSDSALRHLEMINGAMVAPGAWRQSFVMSYWAATGRGNRRKYMQSEVSHREVVPYRIAINKTGGIYFMGLDRSAVATRLEKLYSNPRYKNAFDSRHQAIDLMNKYLENLASDNPQASTSVTGLNATRRNFYNEVFGFEPRQGQGLVNPQAEGRKPAKESVVKSFRIERIGRLSDRGQPRAPFNEGAYRHSQVNYQPSGGDRFQPAGNVDTPEFRKWHGNSVLKEPVWHGTTAEFEEFRPTTGAKMNFVTKDGTFALRFSDGKNLMYLWAKAENPFDSANPAHLSNLGSALGQLLLNAAAELPVNGATVNDIITGLRNRGGIGSLARHAVARFSAREANAAGLEIGTGEWVAHTDATESKLLNSQVSPELAKLLSDAIVGEIKEGADSSNWYYLEMNSVTDVIRQMGHDSIRMFEEGVETWGLFDPNQLKSFYNHGGWSTDNNNIYYQPVVGREAWAPDHEYRKVGVPAVRELASSYARKAGIHGFKEHAEAVAPNIKQLARIADWLEQQPHQPNHPKVKAGYGALAKEILAQYDHMIEAGYRPQRFDGQGEPYASSGDMIADVAENKHLWFFATDNGYGQGGSVPDHPMLAKSGRILDGQELLLNDVFRIVHDFYGHAQHGYQFGPKGELNAYIEHASMLSETARGALAAETLAQNAWVNYGKHIRRADGTAPVKGDPDWIRPQERPFSEQKAVYVPRFLREEVSGAKYQPAILGVAGELHTDAPRFNSPKFKQLRLATGKIASSLGLRGKAFDMVGGYFNEDLQKVSMEASLRLYLGTDDLPTARVAAALAGALAPDTQHSVMLAEPNPNGEWVEFKATFDNGKDLNNAIQRHGELGLGGFAATRQDGKFIFISAVPDAATLPAIKDALKPQRWTERKATVEFIGKDDYEPLIRAAIDAPPASAKPGFGQVAHAALEKLVAERAEAELLTAAEADAGDGDRVGSIQYAPFDRLEYTPNDEFTKGRLDTTPIMEKMVLGKAPKSFMDQVADYLTGRTLKRIGKPILDWNDRRVNTLLFEALLSEARYAIKNNANALGWYDKTLEKAFRRLNVIHPELQTDRNARVLYTAYIAFTSNGLEPVRNFKIGDRLYREHKRTGKVPLGFKFEGNRAKAMKGHLEIMAKLIDHMGMDGFVDFMQTKAEVRDIEKRVQQIPGLEKFSIGGESVDYVGPGALVFGSKLGSFFNNLWGDLDTLTMDRWFMRTINRLRGMLTDPDISAWLDKPKKAKGKEGEISPGQITKLMNALGSVEEFKGWSREQWISALQHLHADAHANKIKRRQHIIRGRHEPLMRKLAEAYREMVGEKFKQQTPLKNAAKNLWVSVGLNDAPRAGGERAAIRKVMRRVQDQLKAEGTDISTADLQAVLWYYEKELWMRLGYEDPKGAAKLDYADAAASLLEDYIKRGEVDPAHLDADSVQAVAELKANRDKLKAREAEKKAAKKAWQKLDRKAKKAGRETPAFDGWWKGGMPAFQPAGTVNGSALWTHQDGFRIVRKGEGGYRVTAPSGRLLGVAGSLEKANQLADREWRRRN